MDTAQPSSSSAVSTAAASHWLTRVLKPLRDNNAWNASVKELLGSNLPIMMMTASRCEFWDQAINQLGDNFPVFQGGWAIDQVVNKALKAVVPQSFQGVRTAEQQAHFELGKAFILYPLLTSYVVASPLMRNAIMSHVTKKDNFVDLVGLKNNATVQQEESPEHRQKRLHVEGKTWKTIAGIMGAGVVASIAGFAFTVAGLQKNKPLPEWMTKRVIQLPFAKQAESIHSLLHLPNGEFKHITDTALLLSWGLPSYAGMLMGSRDDLEWKENMTRAVWFAFAFVAAPHLVEAPLENWLGKQNNALWGEGKNLVYLGQLATSVGLYSAMPMLANRLFRRSRTEKSGLLQNDVNPTGCFEEETIAPPRFSAVSLAPALPSAPMAEPPLSLPVVPIASSMVWNRQYTLATLAQL